jgi:S1-C subfamily serine protease
MTGRDPDREGMIARARAAIVGLRAIVPSDALTADVLGTERVGSGVLIDATGLVVTIGYLVTEAERVWLALGDGRVVAGDVVGIDQTSGLALVRALARGIYPTLPIGSARAVRLGSRVTLASGDGRHADARLVARQPFAGYWEYSIDDALFSAPAHDQWGGAALVSAAGQLIGVGSLHVPAAEVAGRTTDLNMSVPIDLLGPVRDDLLRSGRTAGPARPWLGIYTYQNEGHLLVGGLVRKGPAKAAGLQSGDIIRSVAGTEVRDLAAFYGAVWALGSAGVDVPLTIARGGAEIVIVVRSGERRAFLKQPTLH